MSDVSLPEDELAPLPRTAAYRRSFPTLRTVAALVLREMSTRYGRTPGGFLWALLQPLATVLILGFAFSLLARTPSLGTSFLLFKATGLLPFTLFKTSTNMMGNALMFSKSLLVYPGVTWIDALLARFILNFIVVTVVTILIIAGIIIALDLKLILDWGRIALATGLAALLGFGIGVLNCFLMERLDVWRNIWGIITAPLMLASGIIMLYDELPTVAQNVLWYNPVLHITGMMRQGFYSTYQTDYISVNYVVFFSMLPMVAGLILLRRYHRYLLNR